MPVYANEVGCALVLVHTLIAVAAVAIVGNALMVTVNVAPVLLIQPFAFFTVNVQV